MQQIKTWMFPIAMIVGGVLHSYSSYVSFLTPYLIFIMLLITYCKYSIDQIIFNKMHLLLAVIQLAVALLFYFIFRHFGADYGQAALICVLAPTASSAAVVTGMLGGNVRSITAYSILINLTVAIGTPFILGMVCQINNLPLWSTMVDIAIKIIPLLGLPILISYILQRWVRPLHRFLQNSQQVSYYLWAVALTIVAGKTVDMLLLQPASNYQSLWIILVISLLLCVMQFALGRYIGARFGDTIAAGQSLGQKNTILAIWLAQMYLTPLASIAPASYVLWQNIINSYQLAHKRTGGS